VSEPIVLKPNADGTVHITEGDINTIAEAAAKKAIEHVYMEIGRSVMKKIAWAIGVLVMGILLTIAGREVFNK
jgi:uncharacterized membrane protein